MKHILYLISLLLLLGACTDETYTDEPSANGGKPGKPVPVNLSLSIQPLQSPLDAGTKAGGETISSTEVCKGMEISLVKTPVAPATRAADMNEIKNFWVFQFNGTKPESTLAKASFYSTNEVKTVTLATSSSGQKNRIIVIANAEQGTFSELQTTPTNYTLADFNNLGIAYDDESSSFPANYPLFTPTVTPSSNPPRPVLSGSTDMVVAKNSQADIMLYRSTAQVTVKLRLGNAMQNKYTHWSYQFMSVPKKTVYHSIGRTPAFPGSSVGYADYKLTGISLSTTTSTIENVNLPVNLQHPVEYTTPEKRRTNAPLNATYLQIVGMQMTSGNIISRSVIYQIHLGSNFTDDYSVSPNFSYTYNITITGENADDSRVIKFIPGYFGGKLTRYKADGSELKQGETSEEAVSWRYKMRNEVYISDVNSLGGIQWQNSGSMPGDLNSLMDGRKNTWELRQSTNYLAIAGCFALNSPEPGTMDAMTWYTPSFGQSLAIYVGGSNTLKTLPNTFYWSSTANGTYAWGTQVWTGESTPQSPSESYNLRCIKDLNLDDAIQ